MSLIQELKERRLVQIIISYAAAGWVALSVISQLVEMSVIPGIVYRVGLVLYLGGLVAASITGWYHGERGHQEWTKPEISMLAVVGILTLIASGLVVVREQGAARRAALVADSELDLNRVAVLFFADRSRDEDRSYLAEGITTGLIDELSTVRDLTVLSRNASEQVRGLDVGYDSIARILEAGVLVDGSVQEAGGTVRVNAVLIDGSSGSDLGEIHFEESEADVLGLQETLVSRVAERLREILGTEVQLAQTRADTESGRAWTALQRGERAVTEARNLFNAGNDAGMMGRLSAADSLFRVAAGEDPNWALPWVRRAEVARVRSVGEVYQNPGAARGTIDRGLALADSALARDPRSAEAFSVRGLLRYYLWEFGFIADPLEAENTFSASLADLEQAVDADPDLATAWQQLSVMYSQQAELAEANFAARRAYEADRFLTSAPQVLFSLYTTSYDLEQFPRALEYCDEARERFPDISQFTECRLWLMATRTLPDDPGVAWSTLDDFLALVPEQNRAFERSKGEMVVAMVLARAAQGNPPLADSARAVARRARASAEVDPTQELRSLEALVYLELGDRDEALDVLQAYLTANPEHRSGWRWSSHWWWRDLQDDPRFRRLVGI